VVLEDLMEVAGVNSQEQLAELEDLFVDRIRRKWMNNGVVIHNPNTVYIDDEVAIEPDVEIFQNCILKGKTTVRTGCSIGPNSLISDSYVSEDCILEGHNILVHAHVPEGHILGLREQFI
jgi:bifunctional UDP-N-acetylglucosamine pyrophosphorylase/glucosamine-1-phosphate N-acetyltransferase